MIAEAPEFDDLRQELATFEIPLPRTLPTTNVRKRMHWRTEAKVVKGLRIAACLHAAAARRKADVEDARQWAPTPQRAIRFTLVRGKGQKLMDPDAIAAALKPTLDGIQDAGWFFDDSSRYLVYEKPRQERGPLPLVRVTIWSLPA